MEPQEYSESGVPIYNYTKRKYDNLQTALGNPENIEAISKHIEKYIGKIEMVFHEIISDIVHIDVHWVKPTEDQPFHILVTSGMSDMPMNVPDGLEEFRYTELYVLLPSTWKIDTVNSDIFNDERNYWPIRWLKTIATFPHQFDTWVGNGHTIPNGENAEPFANDTKLGCIMLMPSITLNKKFYELKINAEKTIKFYCMYPLYKEEMEFKLKRGTDNLLDKFDKHQITDVIDINRINTCKKKGLFGLW